MGLMATAGQAAAGAKAQVKTARPAAGGQYRCSMLLGSCVNHSLHCTCVSNSSTTSSSMLQASLQLEVVPLLFGDQHNHMMLLGTTESSSVVSGSMARLLFCCRSWAAAGVARLTAGPSEAISVCIDITHIVYDEQVAASRTPGSQTCPHRHVG